MINYNRIPVNSKEQLDELYNHSAFTMEGLDEKSIPDLLGWVKECGAITEETPTVYIINGGIMNMAYNLTGDNAYGNDLTIISVMGIDLMKVAIPRFTIGGRWFDDVVDNNLRRERGE